MELKITFRQMDHTEALDNLIREKSGHLDKFLYDNAEINWTCWTQEGTQTSEVKINNNGNIIIAHSSTDHLYKSVDETIQKASKQLVAQKEKRKNH